MATINDMGVPGDGVGGGLLQPFHKHRWSVEFLFGDTRGLTAMALTADRPKLEFEQIQIERYNSRAWIFGKHTFQPINITFEPDIGARVHQAVIEQLETQQNLIAEGAGPFLGQAVAGQDYKFNLKLKMWDGHHQGTGTLLEEWELESCGIENNDFGDLDYSASDTVKTTLTIRYDHARLIPFSAGHRKATGNPI